MTWTLTTSPTRPAGFGAGIDGGANGGDIALERDRHQAAANLVLLDERDIGGLEGRVTRFDRGHDALGLDQSDCFAICHCSLQKSSRHEFQMFKMFNIVNIQIVSIQFAVSTATVCSATIISSLVGTIQISHSLSTVLILVSLPRPGSFA